jgi:DNA-directed RNA polymerase subunit RPC12/RpoP
MGTLIPLPPLKVQGVIFEKQELWVCPYCRSLMVFSRTECHNCGAPYLPSDDQVEQIQKAFDNYFESRRPRRLRRKASTRP